MTENLQNDAQASTNSTKKSILIRPDNDADLNDFIQITKFPAGKKTREAITRLATKYHFTEQDFKKNRISITLDFAAFKT